MLKTPAAYESFSLLELDDLETFKRFYFLFCRVAGQGADFLFVIFQADWNTLRRGSVELRDDQVIFEDEVLAGVPPRELMFEHDSHFNRRGQRRLAKVVIAPLEKALRRRFDEHAS